MKIAIIGAGMAGLAAAEILVKQHEVTLYEASDRVGGRAWTVDIGGEAMDWGCEALEAGDGAPTAVLKKHGKAADEPDICFPNVRFFSDEGKGVDFDDVTADEKMKKNVEAAKSAYTQAEKLRSQKNDDALQLLYKRVSKEDDVTAGVDLSPGPSRIDALLSACGSFSESSILGESSAFDRARSEVLKELGKHEGDTTYFKEGLGNVVLAWAKENVLFKANMDLRLSTPITLIKNVEDGVLVVPQLLKHGSGTVFDAVIVTVPTGVIESGALTINDLSGGQMAAFRDCPLGYYHKIVVTGLGKLECPAPNQRVYMCDKDLNYAFFLSASPKGAYYMAHIAGAQAVYCNANPEWTEKTLVAMLQELNPKAKKPEKLTFYHSDWHSNERIRGAYSYSKIGKGPARELLHKLTVGRIYFAGEACSLMWYGGLAGAMETGQDAALRLLDALK